MHVRRHGSGPPVLLIHGSLLGGRHQWTTQTSLAERWELLIADRAGYGPDDDGVGEDFHVDADELTALLDGSDGMHVVGFSYGAVGAMLAAARRPDKVRSLALIEPSVWSVAFDRPEVRAQYDSIISSVFEFEGDPGGMTQAFLDRVGAQQQVRTDRLPRALQVGARAVMNGRPSGEARLPLDALGEGRYPSLVISGDHSPAFEIICDRVASRLGARREQAAGAGHGVPALGAPVNVLLEELWVAAERGRGAAERAAGVRSPATSGG